MAAAKENGAEPANLLAERRTVPAIQLDEGEMHAAKSRAAKFVRKVAEGDAWPAVGSL